MARLEELPEPMRSHVAQLRCSTFPTQPWAQGAPLNQRRVSIVSTAGLHQRDDRPFISFSGEYRIIPGNIAADDIAMSHLSINFDRTGFQLDHNVAFPIDRLRELAEEGFIGSVADFHYSFMGADSIVQMKPMAKEMVDLLKKDNVDAVLLVPV